MKDLAADEWGQVCDASVDVLAAAAKMSGNPVVIAMTPAVAALLHSGCRWVESAIADKQARNLTPGRCVSTGHGHGIVCSVIDGDDVITVVWMADGQLHFAPSRDVLAIADRDLDAGTVDWLLLMRAELKRWLDLSPQERQNPDRWKPCWETPAGCWVRLPH